MRGACWQSIYYYFNKWSKDGSFKRVWINLLQSNKKLVEYAMALHYSNLYEKNKSLTQILQ
jgi:hypothetical protein